eukprot:9990888-Alexandrium_andersonii.AAC.1
MSASLVGSEMCIRDRARPIAGAPNPLWERMQRGSSGAVAGLEELRHCRGCLLYTSDAADDM